MKVLSTRGVSSEIEDIIRYAKNHIILVSPYLKIDPRLFERLCQAGNKGIDITIIYGKKELLEQVRRKYNNIPNCSFYFNERLHAKAYLNESRAVLSSMNLHEFSESHNFELGFVCKSDDESHIYNDIVEEIDLIKTSSQKRFSSKQCVIESTIGEKLKRKREFELVGYPKEHITLHSNEGSSAFAVFDLDPTKYDTDELQEDLFYSFQEHLSHDYRFYWNGRRLSLYADKQFKGTPKTHIDYYTSGIKTLGKLIEEHIQ